MKVKLTEQLTRDLDLRIEKEEDLPLEYKHLGICADIEGINANTGQRSAMGPMSISRAMPLLRPELPLVDSGFSTIMAEYLHSTNVPVSGVVILKQYKSEYETKLIIQASDGSLHDVDVTTFIKTNEKYGFMLEYTPLFMSLCVGEYVTEGDVLAKSFQDVNGVETNTVNLVGLAGYFNQSSEDSVLLSESACKKLETVTYHEFFETVKKEDLLLNLYGDENNYQPLPKLGQYLRKDRALMAKRNMKNTILAPSLMNNKALMEFDESFDRVEYGPDSNCKVVKIEVINSEHNSVNKFPEALRYIYEIGEAQKRENEQLLNTYRNNGYPDCSANLTLNLVTAHAINNLRGLKYKMVKLEGLRIKITLEEKIIPGIRSKVSGKYGNKGIVCGVIPDEDMPISESGMRVDYIYEAGSVLNRNNSTVTTIGGLAMQIRQTTIKIKAMYGMQFEETIDINMFKRVKESTHEAAFSMILSFLNLSNSPLFGPYQNAYNNKTQDYYDILLEVLNDELRIITPLPNESVIVQMEQLYYSGFKLRKEWIHSGLSNKGVMVKFEDEMSLTVQAVMLHNKLGDKVMAVNTPFENHYELPTALNPTDRHGRQINYSAVKLMGNTEKRTLEANVPTECLSEYIELGKDPEARNYAYGTLLRDDGFPKKIVDRDVIAFGKDPFKKLYHSITRCMGFISHDFSTGYSEEDKYEDDVVNEKFKFSGKF